MHVTYSNVSQSVPLKCNLTHSIFFNDVITLSTGHRYDTDHTSKVKQTPILLTITSWSLSFYVILGLLL